MKSNPLISVLMAALFVNAAGTAWLSFQYVRSARNLEMLQAQSRTMQRQINLFGTMVKETANYSQAHKTEIPALRTLGINMEFRSNAAPANAKAPNK